MFIIKNRAIGNIGLLFLVSMLMNGYASANTLYTNDIKVGKTGAIHLSPVYYSRGYYGFNKKGGYYNYRKPYHGYSRFRYRNRGFYKYRGNFYRSKRHNNYQYRNHYGY